MVSVFSDLVKKCFPTFNVRKIFFCIFFDIPSSLGQQTLIMPPPPACYFENFKLKEKLQE